MADEQSPKSFWQTIPGILAAVATVLTAATGLVVALNQSGFFAKSPQESPITNTSIPAVVATAPPAASIAPVPVSPAPVTPRAEANAANRDAITGVWFNDLLDSRNGRPESRLVIGRLPNGTLTVQGWGNCQPRECDWGVAPLEVVAGDPATSLIGLRATTKLVRVIPSQNREDVTYLTLRESGSPSSLTVRRRFESYINGRLNTRIERIAAYTRKEPRSND